MHLRVCIHFAWLFLTGRLCNKKEKKSLYKTSAHLEINNYLLLLVSPALCSQSAPSPLVTCTWLLGPAAAPAVRGAVMLVAVVAVVKGRRVGAARLCRRPNTPPPLAPPPPTFCKATQTKPREAEEGGNTCAPEENSKTLRDAGCVAGPSTPLQSPSTTGWRWVNADLTLLGTTLPLA